MLPAHRAQTLRRARLGACVVVASPPSQRLQNAACSSATSSVTDTKSSSPGSSLGLRRLRTHADPGSSTTLISGSTQHALACQNPLHEKFHFVRCSYSARGETAISLLHKTLRSRVPTSLEGGYFTFRGLRHCPLELDHPMAPPCLQHERTHACLEGTDDSPQTHIHTA